MKNGFRPYLLMLLIPLAITLVLMLSASYWQNLDLRCSDLRFKASESLGLFQGKATGRVVLVGIEDDELIKTKPLIFWYPDIGRFLLTMKESGARAVAMDMIPVASLGERVMESAGAIVGGEISPQSRMVLEALGEKTDNSLLGPMIAISDQVTVIQAVAEGTVPFFYSSMAFMENIKPASVRIEPDADHVMRRQALIQENIDTFPHALYRALTGSTHPAKSIIINYPLRHTIPYYTFSEVLKGKVPPSAFAGKGVILGYINKYLDVQPTPVRDGMSGALIHAITVETMLTGTELKESSNKLVMLLILILAAAATAVSLRQRPLFASICIALLTLAYLVFNFIAFTRGLIVPIFPPLIAPLAIFGAIFPYRYLVEERTRRKIYRMFSYYMDGAFIDSLMERDAESILKGEYKNVAVLFLDIRDFTGFCENRPADQTVTFLNSFCDRMSGIIQQHNGVVNKIIGDAILAFFWDEKDGSVHALAASEEMLKAVDGLNNDPSLAQVMGDWRLRIGIGMHYGSVLMGNIGSTKKMDFTIIGTTVNIASRMEGLNKRHNTRLLLSKDAWKAAGSPYEIESIGFQTIRGLKVPMELYTLKEDAFVVNAAQSASENAENKRRERRVS
jgi:class 3 adenylate cyclase/CHASE2 domain-containing sensor protein